MNIQFAIQKLDEARAALVKLGGPTLDIADTSELDSDFGDPVIKWDPKKWVHPSRVGSSFSHCTPEELDDIAADRDRYAAYLDQKGEVDAKGRPKSYFAKKDARLARGWAARMRAAGGRVEAKQSPAQPDGDVPWL